MVVCQVPGLQAFFPAPAVARGAEREVEIIKLGLASGWVCRQVDVKGRKWGTWNL